MNNKIEEKIRELHHGDKEQLDVVSSNEKRIIVEAPAGYGKTQTLISKIAFLLASLRVCNPKKILALTFSVNAAYKIKKDVAEKLPTILDTASVSPQRVGSKILATNYHGFCRRVLRICGYLLHSKLTEMDYLKGIDDGNAERLVRLKIGLNIDKAMEMSRFGEAIKKIDIEYLRKYASSYSEIIKEFLLPANYIPFNAILVLALELFTEHPEILRFYQSYFPVIIVDEFQDTNILSWSLLKKLVHDKTRLILMGDSLQRIYGFIGAIPDLINIAQREFKMHKIELRKNYRFINNKQLIELDRNIRENARDPRSPAINHTAKIKVFEAEDQNEEAKRISKLIRVILKNDAACKIAVLVKQRGQNVNRILEQLRRDSVDFFYALYSEEDKAYIEFHRNVLNAFINIIAASHGRMSKIICRRILRKAESLYADNTSEINVSLLRLLETFFSRVFVDFAFLTIEEKIELVRDTLESNTLKQYLGYVDSNVIVTTVHGAKGLEWDYVILPDMEQYSFPNYVGLCNSCQFKKDCLINWNSIERGSSFEKDFYEELSVFYVATTRARKKVFFSRSKKRINQHGEDKQSNISCLLKLNGISCDFQSF